MSVYKIKNLDFLKVLEEENKISFGFSQEWYEDEYKKLAGCGATVAATIITYFKQKENKESLSIDKVMPLMLEMWNYLTPIKNKGLNSTKLFYDGIEKYFSEKNKIVDCKHIDVNIKDKVSLDKIILFLKESLEKDIPLAFLNLCNGEEKELDKWHWVTVVELFSEGENYFINILDDKEIKKINLTLWYNTITDDGGFISFKV